MDPHGDTAVSVGRWVRRLFVLPVKVAVALVAVTYYFLVRSALLLLAAFVALYFLSGTTLVRAGLEQLLADALPGQLLAATIQWGPTPWEVDVAHVRLLDERGDRVFHVPAVSVDVNVLGTLAAAVESSVRSDAPITLLVDRVRISRPWLNIHVRPGDGAGVNIERAFVAPDDPDNPKPPGAPINLDIEVAEAVVRGAHGRVHTSDFDIQVEGLDAYSDFQVKGLDPWPQFTVPRATAERVIFGLRPSLRGDGRLERARTAARHVEIRWYAFRGDWFKVKAVTAALDDGQLDAHGTMVVDPDRLALSAWAHVQTGPASTVLADLSDGQARGPLDLTVQGVTDFERHVTAQGTARSPKLLVAGAAVTQLAASFDVAPDLTPEAAVSTPDKPTPNGPTPNGPASNETPRDAPSHRFTVRHLAADALGGHLEVRDATLRSQPSLDRALNAQAMSRTVEATATLRDVDPAQALALPALAPAGARGPRSSVALWRHVIQGALNGTCTVAAGWDEGGGDAELAVRTEGLTMAWGRAAGLPLASRYRLEGGVRWTRDLLGRRAAGPLDLRMHEQLRLEGLRLRSGADEAVADGALDLDSGALSFTGTARVGDLARFLGPLGVRGVGGHLTVRDARVGGTTEDPAGRAEVRVRGATLAGRPLGDVRATLDLTRGLLSAANVRANTGWGSLAASGKLRLWRDRMSRPDHALPFTVTALDVRNLSLAALLPAAGVRGTMRLHLPPKATLRGSAARPLESLRGRASLEVANLRGGGERARRLTASFEATDRWLRLRNLNLALCGPGAAPACPRGGPTLRGSVGLSKPGQRGPRGESAVGARTEAHLQADRFPLEALRVLGSAASLRGDLTADVSAEGPLAEPRLMGTVQVRDFSVGPLELGDAGLTLTWGEGQGETVLTPAESFPDTTLEEGRLRLSEAGARVELAAVADRLRVFERLLPSLAVPRLGLEAQGHASVRLALPSPKPWSVRVDVPTGGARVLLYDERTTLTATSPVVFEMGPEGMRLPQPTSWSEPGGRQLTLCGVMRLGGEDEDPTLDLALTGALGAELAAPALSDTLSVLEGSLVVGTGDTQDPTLPACLGTPSPPALHVTGALTAPVVQGRVRAVGVRLVPRDFGRAFVVDDGAELVLRRGRGPADQLVSFPRDGARRLSGELDDGTFGVWGELSLDALEPRDATLHVEGTDLSFVSRGEFNATVSPDLVVRARDFQDPVRRDLAVSGQVRVVEGTYYKSFDQFARAFGAATGAQADGYSAPLTERLPWLGDTLLDVDVHGSGFAVRSPFPLGSADLDTRMDVHVGGTLGAPQVFNRVDILPGGRIQYRVFQREFEVVRGTLDFSGDPDRPRIDLAAQTEVEYLERVSNTDEGSEEKQVVITVTITGVLPDDLDIQLSSTPAGFDQGDLQSLIFTGKPRADDVAAREDNLFSLDIGRFFNALLAAPFVDAVNFGLTQEGFVDTEVITRFGRDLRLRTRAVQEAGNATRLNARFQFHISDSVVLEGSVDRTTGSSTTAADTYEARIKYRIPLD